MPLNCIPEEWWEIFLSLLLLLAPIDAAAELQ
jgi:hypothetical protein